MKIIATPHPPTAVAAALSNHMAAAPERPRLLLVAGGSLPQQVLPHVSQETFGPHITVCVFDERCTTDPAGSNQQQLASTTWYHAALECGVQELPVTVTAEAQCAAVAADWERALRRYTVDQPDGEVIVLAGVGADGHIAGILCHTPAETPVFTDSAWIVHHRFADTDNQYPARITPTFTGWREAVDRTFIYIDGAAKAQAVAAIQAATGDLYTTPARILRELPRCELYTDAPMVPIEP